MTEAFGLMRRRAGLDRVAHLLRRKWWVATFGAVAAATLTPFCSSGTTAMLLVPIRQIGQDR